MHKGQSLPSAGDTTLDESMTHLRQLPPLPPLSKRGTSVSSSLDIDDELDHILSGTVKSLPKDEEKNSDTKTLPHSSVSLNSFSTPSTNRLSLPPLPPLKSNIQPAAGVFPSALDHNEHRQQEQTSKMNNDDYDYSLSKEPLSELEEELDDLTSSSCADSDHTPLMMTSDQLKALDDTKMVSSDEGEDYNKMAETSYKETKAEMDRQFELKRKKPTDSDYVYDKEEDYGKATMESVWDKTSSDSDF